LKRFGLSEPIRNMAGTGKPIMGTCAGCIVLARKLVDQVGPQEVEPLALMDITVNRNAYGRQKESFERPLDIPGFGYPFTGVFIRAPSIVEVGDGVEVLATQDSEPVMVRQNNILALTFHPELVLDSRVHQYFLKMI
jgi:5'-phosphate synthase pdxT subunit